MSKEKRDRLFKSGRPQLRKVEIYDGDKYHKDVGYLWVAHTKKPFGNLGNVSQEEFARWIEKLSKGSELIIIEDFNRELGKTGPVGLIGISSDGWLVEPYAEFFKWATARNILRCAVSFLQMIRYRKIGACLIKSAPESVSLLNKVCKYGVLHFVGKVPNGDPHGDLWLYSIRGKA